MWQHSPKNPRRLIGSIIGSRAKYTPRVLNETFLRPSVFWHSHFKIHIMTILTYFISSCLKKGHYCVLTYSSTRSQGPSALLTIQLVSLERIQTGLQTRLELLDSETIELCPRDSTTDLEDQEVWVTQGDSRPTTRVTFLIKGKDKTNWFFWIENQVSSEILVVASRIAIAEGTTRFRDR
jgi:hypothetical protein